MQLYNSDAVTLTVRAGSVVLDADMMYYDNLNEDLPYWVKAVATMPDAGSGALLDDYWADVFTSPTGFCADVLAVSSPTVTLTERGPPSAPLQLPPSLPPPQNSGLPPPTTTPPSSPPPDAKTDSTQVGLWLGASLAIAGLLLLLIITGTIVKICLTPTRRRAVDKQGLAQEMIGQSLLAYSGDWNSGDWQSGADTADVAARVAPRVDHARTCRGWTTTTIVGHGNTPSDALHNSVRLDGW